MAGKGGGAWKVAYADFVTAMMAFFLVMWITSQNKETKVAIAQYFENPLGTEAEARATSVHGIEGASANAPLAGAQAGPHGTNRDGVAEENGGATKAGAKAPPPVRIFEKLDKTRSVGAMLVFEEHSAEVTGDARAQLLRLIPQLLGKPNKVEIRGHASHYPLPKGNRFGSAWDLSYARCQATRDLLLKHGIAPERIRMSQDGDSDPYGNSRRDPKQRELSSRVEVFAVSEFVHGNKRSHLDRYGEFDFEENLEPKEEEAADQENGEQDAAGAKPDGSDGHGKAAHGKAEHGKAGHGKPAAAPAKGHAKPQAEPAAKKSSGHH
jgi:chemotaxis protein MotB